MRDSSAKSAPRGAPFHRARIDLQRRRVLTGLPRGTAASLGFDVLPRLVPGRVAAVPAAGDTVDIGTPAWLPRERPGNL